MKHNYVLITAPNGQQYSGEVISASNYGRLGLDDWYIEFKDRTNGNKARYLKQQYDGFAAAKIEFFESESDLNNAITNGSPLGRAFYQPWEY